MKILLKDGYYNAQEKYERLREASLVVLENVSTLAAVYQLVGKDFYFINMVPSRRKASSVFEGTRLTVVQRAPEGIEFTTKTPGYIFDSRGCCSV